MLVATHILSILLTIGPFVEGVDVGVGLDGGIYVVDAGMHRVTKYSAAGDSIASFGGFGDGERGLNRPIAIAAGPGTDIFVADRNNHRIVRLDRNLAYQSTIARRDADVRSGAFGYPLDVVASRQGDLYVLDGEHRRVVVFGADGRFLRLIGDVGAGKGRLHDPIAIDLDEQDRLYVLESNGGILQIYDPFGTFLRRFTLPGKVGIDRFSVDRGHLCLSVGDSLRLGRLTDRGPEQLSFAFVGITGAGRILLRDSLLYVIDSNRLAVAEFGILPVDTLHDRR